MLMVKNSVVNIRASIAFLNDKLIHFDPALLNSNEAIPPPHRIEGVSDWLGSRIGCSTGTGQDKSTGFQHFTLSGRCLSGVLLPFVSSTPPFFVTVSSVAS